MPEETTIKHPSFGVINLVKGTYIGEGREGQKPLFGSNILHNSFIGIKISSAVLHRGLYRDWISPDSLPPIVELEISATQFADFITSPGKGEGTSCTIVAINGKSVPQATLESKRIQFDREFEEKMKEISSEVSHHYKTIAELLSKPNLGKADRQEILNQIKLLRQEIAKNVPFIKEQFTEQMEQTITEAKGEIESFFESKVRSLGLEGFKNELAQQRAMNSGALEDKNNA